MATKVAIQYGFFGGQHRGIKFRRALKKAGYAPVKDTSDADIIVAQSAGCFWLPKAPTAQRLMLINPPYWPEKTINERARARIKSNREFKKFGYPTSHWIWRMLVGVYYAVVDIPRNRRIMNFAPHYNLEDIIQGHNVLIVRNQHDDWLTPDLSKLKAKSPTLQVAQLPGDHDDCWFNPEPYVALLNRLGRS